MIRLTQFSVIAAVLAGGVFPGTAGAQTDLSKFPLMKAVPADVFITVAARHNPERKFLDDYWGEVSKTFLDSGILEDVWDLVTEKVPDEELDKIEELREQFGGLCGDVAWGELFSNEMIYAGRLNGLPQNGSPYEGVLIGRMKSKKDAAGNYKALKAILEEIVKLVEAKSGEKAVSLGELEIDGITFTTFGPSVLPQMVCLGSRDDLVIVSLFNRSILQDSMGLLKGSSKKGGLVETERFKKAFKGLPPAEDSLVFWDVSNMFGKIKEMIEAAAPTKKSPDKRKAHGPAGKKPKKDAKEDDEADDEGEADKPGAASDDERWVGMVAKLLDDLAILDYTAKVEWTDGYQVLSEEISALAPNAKSKPLCGVLAGGAPVEKFERFVPKEATNFWCSSGVSFLKLYKYIAQMVEEFVPEGKQHIAEFSKGFEDELGLNLEKDLLAMFDGGLMTASIKDDWIVMIKVTDEKKASQTVSRLLETINGKLGQQNALMMSEVEVADGKKFKQISHPMMLMMGGFKPPVLGFAEGHLILASSADTVAMCLETAQGKHANITKNKRWSKEALIPKAGPVDSISFKDESNTAAELQKIIGALSMATGFAGMVGQDMPPEVRGFISSVAPILAKLNPVVAKMDFYQSSAAYQTFDGNAWHSRRVQNYKEPKSEAQQAETRSGAKTEQQGEKKESPKKERKERKPKAGRRGPEPEL